MLFKKSLFYSYIISSLILSACSSAYYKESGDVVTNKTNKKIAIVSFQNNSVITGGNGAGTILSGALTAKTSGSGLTMDQNYIDDIYKAYSDFFSKKGYIVISSTDISKDGDYQNAETFEIPTMKSATNLRPIKMNSTLAKKLAQNLKVDYVFVLSASQSLEEQGSMLAFIGGGKKAGKATIDLTIYNNTGKQVYWANAAEESDDSSMHFGGVQNPKDIYPLFKEANAKLLQTLDTKL